MWKSPNYTAGNRVKNFQNCESFTLLYNASGPLDVPLRWFIPAFRATLMAFLCLKSTQKCYFKVHGHTCQWKMLRFNDVEVHRLPCEATIGNQWQSAIRLGKCQNDQKTVFPSYSGMNHLKYLTIAREPWTIFNCELQAFETECTLPEKIPQLKRWKKKCNLTLTLARLPILSPLGWT